MTDITATLPTAVQQAIALLKAAAPDVPGVAQALYALHTAGGTAPDVDASGPAPYKPNPEPGQWYWVKNYADNDRFQWVPAVCNGETWSSASFQDVDQESIEVGSRIAHEDQRETKWPKSRETGRMGDMTPKGMSHLRIILDNDSDVVVSVYNGEEQAVASVEFCTGMNGGGKSIHTRQALIATMKAMEADNISRPEAAYPPIRKTE